MLLTNLKTLKILFFSVKKESKMFLKILTLQKISTEHLGNYAITDPFCRNVNIAVCNGLMEPIISPK
jgi:hypothetical protein